MKILQLIRMTPLPLKLRLKAFPIQKPESKSLGKRSMFQSTKFTEAKKNQKATSL